MIDAIFSNFSCCTVEIDLEPIYTRLKVVYSFNFKILILPQKKIESKKMFEINDVYLTNSLVV